jgi:hypothetical protein
MTPAHVWLLRALVIWACVWFIARRMTNNANQMPWRHGADRVREFETACMLGFLLTLIGTVWVWPI